MDILENEASYTEVIRSMYVSGEEYWNSFKQKRSKVWLELILVIYLFYILYDSFIQQFSISLYNGAPFLIIMIPVVGILFTLISLTIKRTPFIIALVGICLIILALRWTSWIFVLFVTYISYKMFEVHRQRRIIYFSNKRPEELAKIKKSKKAEPKVEITIRGEE